MPADPHMYSALRQIFDLALPTSEATAGARMSQILKLAGDALLFPSVAIPVGGEGTGAVLTDTGSRPTGHAPSDHEASPVDPSRSPADDDAEISRILAMSEEELRADLIAQGRDPDEVVAGMRRELSAAINRVQERNWLNAAIWEALTPFMDELVATGGVTFMGLRNAVVHAVEPFIEQHRSDAVSWHVEYKEARREKNAAFAPAIPSGGWRSTLEPGSKDEIAAWEAWAIGRGYDMHEHPLHYLFMDTKTDMARQGWKAGLAWAREQVAAQGMEARRGETNGLAAQPDSPVDAVNAPDPSPFPDPITKAQAVLDGLDLARAPEAHIAELRRVAARVHPSLADCMLAHADAIQEALSTLRSHQENTGEGL